MVVVLACALGVALTLVSVELFATPVVVSTVLSTVVLSCVELEELAVSGLVVAVSVAVLGKVSALAVVAPIYNVVEIRTEATPTLNLRIP